MIGAKKNYIEFNAYCEEYNIRHECSAPHAPQQNGQVERNKRTKLGPRGIKYVIVGYSLNVKAYILLNLASNVIIEFRNLEFGDP